MDVDREKKDDLQNIIISKARMTKTDIIENV